MSKCTQRGCRNLSTICEDCNRTVCTKTLEDPAWREMQGVVPENHQPCEYQIVVTCRGWYEPNGDEPRFVPDDRYAPHSEFKGWREWEDGPTYEEGAKLVMDFRKKMMEETNGHV